MSIRSIFTFLLILSGSCAFAQTDSLKAAQDSSGHKDALSPAAKSNITHRYEVKGTVIDKLTREPISFATVFFPYSPVGTSTEADGSFVLQFDELKRDTLHVQAIGYKLYKHVFNRNRLRMDITIELERNASMLNEVVIHAGEDPAITLVKNVIARRQYNNPEKGGDYSYESYSKVELDIVHLSREQFEALPIPYIKNFGFVYNNLDTTSGKEPFLPFFLVETLSDFYHQQSPAQNREFIKASEIRGIHNQSITQYMGRMHLSVNPYNNYLLFFDKQFASPIGNAALVYYKYKIVDTQMVDGHRVIRLSYRPQREGELCFTGNIKIVDSVFALEHIYAELPHDANINWIKNATFYKHYEQLGDSLWFCVKENLTAGLELTPDLIKLPGLIGRKTISYKNIRLNDPQVPEMVNTLKADVTIADSARDKSDKYWAAVRHDTLSKNEKSVYYMFDTLEATPVYHRFKNVIKFLATGVVQFGPIELGPYWNLYSNNAIEGNRFRFSMGTTKNFSKKVYLNGYVAYGTRDDRFKYNVAGLWIPQKHPRMHFLLSRTSDIDRNVYVYDRIAFDNIFNVAVRKPGIPLKLIYTHEWRFEFLKEYYSPFSHSIMLVQKDYTPYHPLPSTEIFINDAGIPVNTVHKTEIDVKVRYAFKEHFIEGNYLRFSLGSKYPIVEAHYAIGIKGILNGGYNYQKVSINAFDEVKIAPLGTLFFNVYAGKYFGTLPYVLLERHPGNETYFYNKQNFSMMNNFEFISDQYVGFNVEHSIGGGIFNLIPGVRKLKLRQFWLAKGVAGSMTPENKALNLNKGYPFRTLDTSPYLEVGTGIENILRIFRIDFAWRLSPKRHPGEPRSKYFGVLGGVKLNF